MVAVSELMSAHPELVAKLRRFSFHRAAQLVGGLGVLPELLENTIRVEILAHLVTVSCHGRVEPSPANLAEWIGKLLRRSPFASKEDPAEDVFVGCVNSAYGSFRIFQGIFGDGAFLVERLLAFFSDKQTFPTFQQTVESILAFLRLTDALAERAGLLRNCAGGGVASAPIKLARWRDLEPKINAVYFSTTDLQQLGIDVGLLEEFIFRDEDRQKLQHESMWGSSLERRPLLKSGDGLVVVEPSTMARSAVRLMTERMRLAGGWGEMFYQQENASIFVNQVRSRLKIEWLDIDPPKAPPETPSLFPAFGVFDIGKPIIMLTYTPPLATAVEDFGGFDKLTSVQQDAWDQYVQTCATQLERIEGFSGGMVLICMATYGRGSILGLREWSDQWDVHIAPLRDWLSLAADGCTAMLLWKLGRHDDERRHYNIELVNPAGLANLVAFWERSDFRLIPRGMDIHHPLNLAAIGCDFAKAIRVTAIQQHDEHCIRSHDGDKWIRLVRHNSRAIFAEDEQAPIYGAIAEAAQSKLIGCTKRGRAIWWVVSPQAPQEPQQRDLLFQLWDCILSWSDRVVGIAEREWPALAEQSIEIRLELPDLERWQRGARETAVVPHAELTIALKPSHNRVVLTIPEGFLRYFNQPKNVAERLIVAAILGAVANLARMDVSRTRLDELTREVTRNEDVRYFHVVESDEIEQLLGMSAHPQPTFISDADTALAELGLADLVRRPENGELIGQDVCRTYLQDIVAEVWKRIESRLSPFSRRSVVAGSLAAIDEISRDEAHWKLTTRSLLAMHERESETMRVLRERRSKQSAATLANRLLVETAQYACNASGGQLFNQAEHQGLLAEMILLNTLAQHRDGIAFGFLEPRVIVHPNGEIDVDERFYATVLSRYLSRRSDRTTERASDDYEKYFQSAEQVQVTNSTDGDARIAALNQVFKPEYGFDVQKLIDLIEVWRSFSLRSSRSGGWLTEDQMLPLLIEGCEFSTDEANAFLDRFTLPIRSAWDRDLPPRCKAEDVYPWRFRRNLSLLMRPLIQVEGTPRAWFISATLFEKSISYILDNLERGTFPERFFGSREMRTHIGRVVNRNGHLFAEKVFAAFREQGFEARLEIEMTELGASRSDGLGDVDVLAWNPPTERVYAVECKRLLTALTAREVIQRLEDFRGDKKTKDSLARHVRRVDWLRTNRQSLATLTGIGADTLRLTPALVTSEIVPMQFYADMQFPTDQVISFEELVGYLQRQLRIE